MVPRRGLGQSAQLIPLWTALMYAWMRSIDSDGVHGWEWPIVGGSRLLDLLVWAGGRRSLRW